MASDLKKTLEEYLIWTLVSEESSIYNSSTVHINRKKALEKENEEERPLFQTLLIVGCLYITAKRLKYFFSKIFESTTQKKLQVSKHSNI